MKSLFAKTDVFFKSCFYCVLLCYLSCIFYFSFYLITQLQMKKHDF